MKSKPSGPLFDDLKPDRYGARGGTASRKIGAMAHEEIGITDKKLAPSFRHRFKSACRNVGIAEDVYDAITRHVEGGASRKLEASTRSWAVFGVLHVFAGHVGTIGVI